MRNWKEFGRKQLWPEVPFLAFAYRNIETP
jgi:hypothetical protein